MRNSKMRNSERTDDMMLLNIHKTGSSWTKTAAYHIGKVDETCTLCGTDKEMDEHIWFCSKLIGDRKDVDPDLVDMDPIVFIVAMRQ